MKVEFGPLIIHPLFEDEIAVAVAPEHPLGARVPVTARDLTDVKWISVRTLP